VLAGSEQIIAKRENARSFVGPIRAGRVSKRKSPPASI
jgi:hypothetical protein